MKRHLTIVLCLFLSALLIGSAFPISAAYRADDVLQSQLQKSGSASVQDFVNQLALSPTDGREWYILALSAEYPETIFTAAV